VVTATYRGIRSVFVRLSINDQEGRKSNGATEVMTAHVVSQDRK
jgi:hypothetical protein